MLVLVLLAAMRYCSWHRIVLAYCILLCKPSRCCCALVCFRRLAVRIADHYLKVNKLDVFCSTDRNSAWSHCTGWHLSSRSSSVRDGPLKLPWPALSTQMSSGSMTSLSSPGSKVSSSTNLRFSSVQIVNNPTCACLHHFCQHARRSNKAMPAVAALHLA